MMKPWTMLNSPRTACTAFCPSNPYCRIASKKMPDELLGGGVQLGVLGLRQLFGSHCLPAAAFRLKGGKSPSAFKRPEHRRGAGRPRLAATAPGHGLGRCWEEDSAARGCDVVGRDCSNWRTRPAPRAGDSGRSRSGDRGIRSESSARSAQRSSLAVGALGGVRTPATARLAS